MECHTLALDGVVELRPRKLVDARGYFVETFRVDFFTQAIGAVEFLQENQSLSRAPGTIRGIHFQTAPYAQAKLVRCLAGSVFDVAVDLRADSPNRGKWVAVALSAEQGNQLWIPAGFGHAFCTLEPDSVVAYKVSAYYSATHDGGVRWDDPAIGIAWPDIADPATLSDKDKVQPLLRDLPAPRAVKA